MVFKGTAAVAGVCEWYIFRKVRTFLVFVVCILDVPKCVLSKFDSF